MGQRPGWQHIPCIPALSGAGAIKVVWQSNTHVPCAPTGRTGHPIHFPGRCPGLVYSAPLARPQRAPLDLRSHLLAQQRRTEAATFLLQH